MSCERSWKDCEGGTVFWEGHVKFSLLLIEFVHIYQRQCGLLYIAEFIHNEKISTKIRINALPSPFLQPSDSTSRHCLIWFTWDWRSVWWDWTHILCIPPGGRSWSAHDRWNYCHHVLLSFRIKWRICINSTFLKLGHSARQ